MLVNPTAALVAHVLQSDHCLGHTCILGLLLPDRLLTRNCSIRLGLVPILDQFV